MASYREIRNLALAPPTPAHKRGVFLSDEEYCLILLALELTRRMNVVHETDTEAIGYLIQRLVEEQNAQPDA